MVCLGLSCLAIYTNQVSLWLAKLPREQPRINTKLLMKNIQPRFF